MNGKLQICKCRACGMVVEVLDAGQGGLNCCGGPMQVFEEKTEDATKEKHVPWARKTPQGIRVTIGKAALHPMEEKHYIQWIEILDGNKAYRQFLKPTQAPEAVFEDTGGKVVAREFCNVHGLWKGEQE
ncbi:MAG TPA: desulfoferrodoxin [Phycisphaerae bacterium]|nr:desulfoferrodoxin [Phycisphaerae bacterium]